MGKEIMRAHKLLLHFFLPSVFLPCKINRVRPSWAQLRDEHLDTNLIQRQKFSLDLNAACIARKVILRAYTFREVFFAQNQNCQQTQFSSLLDDSQSLFYVGVSQHKWSVNVWVGILDLPVIVPLQQDGTLSYLAIVGKFCINRLERWSIHAGTGQPDHPISLPSIFMGHVIPQYLYVYFFAHISYGTKDIFRSLDIRNNTGHS